MIVAQLLAALVVVAFAVASTEDAARGLRGRRSMRREVRQVLLEAELMTAWAAMCRTNHPDVTAETIAVAVSERCEALKDMGLTEEVRDGS